MKKDKFDVNKLSLTEADDLSKVIGTNVRDICDEAADKINKILNKYGMKAKIAIDIGPLDTAPKNNNKKKLGVLNG